MTLKSTALYIRVKNALSSTPALFRIARAVKRAWDAIPAVERRRDHRAYRLLAGMLPADPLVIDIGANHGARTKQILQVRGARVVAVEPNPRLIAELGALAAQAPGRVTVVAAAVGGEPGTAVLHLASNDAFSTISPGHRELVQSELGFEGIEFKDAVEVRVVTVAELVQEYGVPDYVKIDVEGAEPDVISGFPQSVPLVSFEYIPEATSAAIETVDRLQRLAVYEFALSPGESFRLDPWLRADEFIDRIRKLSHTRVWGDIYAREVRLHEDAPNHS